MAVSPDDLDAVRRFCDERSPADMQDQYRFEASLDDNKVTIVERRPPWDGSPGEWTATNVAQLRFAGGMWALYESSAEGRWRKYAFSEPCMNIGDLLDEIAQDPTAIFFG